MLLTFHFVSAELECSPPENIENGRFVPRDGGPKPVGSVVTYRCNSGWVLNSDNNGQITCLEDGTWSEEAPTCVGNTSIF